MTQRAFSDFIGFSRPSAAWRFNSSLVLVQEGPNVWRDDYDPVTSAWRGFLIEEQRTNSIRNNSMVGAAAGTPGTFPTNWAVQSGSDAGISTQIVAVGTEDGIPFVEIRCYGTATATVFGLRHDFSGNIAASLGQVWTATAYLKLVAGSLTGVTPKIAVYEHDSGSLFVRSSSGAVTVGGGPLKAGRSAYSVTIGATTVYAYSDVLFTWSVGAAIDFTLRIGAPQFEQGAFATSTILTTGAAVTRAADTPMVGSLPPWFNPNEGTLYAEAVLPNAAISNSIGIFSIDDGTDSNRLTISKDVTGKAGFASVVGGSVTANLSSAGLIPVGTVAKIAAAYKASDFALSLNGEAAITASAGALPAGLNTTRIGRRYNPALNYINGWLRVLKYKPLRMTNADLQALTT
ncbi:phage head spike fiber domain-containing protein [Cupriavidus numazuensis]|uniref:Uncharacterized protein n=1 Tax=Cupriavidus numazuensis TaxID=221992 RepID=A0ABN7PSP0_9BURK|nr:hypothetical protein [Cupriavidus numazuensis]CAG2129081.1 hypothetical protein LMG26411_00114 [Cupriavidus numazuensis]